MEQKPSPAVPLEPAHTITTKEGGKLHLLGHRQRDSGRIALFQVFVNCNVGKAPRQALVALPLHEIPLHRLKHAEYGGTVEILPGWAPGLPQTRGLTKLELEDELARLRGRVLQAGSPPTGGAYVISRGDAEINLFTGLYGGENGVEISLFRKMRDLFDGWRGIVETAEKAMTRITSEEIETLVRQVVMPDDQIDEIDEIEDIGETVAEGLKDAGIVETNQDLVDFLLARDVNDAVAQSFAMQVAKTQKANGDPMVTDLVEESWAAVRGVGKHPQKRMALLKLLKHYDELAIAK